MKRVGSIAMIRMVAVVAAMLGSSATVAVAQGGAAPAGCTTLACDVQGDWEGARQLILGVAEAMPEDKYGYKPTPAQRSFAEQLMHIAQADGMMQGFLGGKTKPPTLNTKATAKADVIATLRQSFDYGAAVLKEFSDAQFVERVKTPPFMGGSASRVRIAYFNLEHTQDIYGQLVVYLRLNGITPPASRRGV